MKHRLRRKVPGGIRHPGRVIPSRGDLLSDLEDEVQLYPEAVGALP
jgi:hypothetical protein